MLQPDWCLLAYHNMYLALRALGAEAPFIFELYLKIIMNFGRSSVLAWLKYITNATNTYKPSSNHLSKVLSLKGYATRTKISIGGVQD